MKTHKKALALILSIVMLFTMMPTAIFSLGADEASYPVMEQFTAASNTEFHAYYNSIYSATFLDKIDWDDINSSVEYWDSSANNDNSVIAYIKLNAEQTELAGAKRYDLYIAGDGGVGANANSGFIFYFFSVLEEVRGCENFKTSNTTTFYGMFYDCKKLRSITGINWDTSNVTDMSYMFRNCHELTELDLSSFDTSKVTTMKYMFYYCQKLEHIYVGDGWTTVSIANLNDGVFNCCYAIVGGKDNYNENYQYFPPGAEYAKLKEDGGFLTYKLPDTPKEYTVTYEFIGDIIPHGVTIPEEAIYEAGSTVSVSADSSADSYIFSGWSTDDATVENGEFVINNDVHFVGSWTKLYKVEYRYDEDYPVPEGAPTLPDAVYYKPGETVDVLGMPYVERYLFIGWTTEDADIAGNMFDMPEKDVVLYGYFKIPVESIEIMETEDIVLDKNETTRLNVYVKPEDATIKEIIYTSSDETVVTIDRYNNIVAVGEGTATVTVASKDDPTKSDTITVTVKIPVTDISVDKNEINLREDGKDKITVTVTPDATNKEVTYTSSDETVVKVDENGNVEAVGKGNATITVTSKDNPEVTEEIKVTVKNPVTSIEAPEKIELPLDEVASLGAKVNDDASYKGLSYEVEDSSVVKVDPEGDIIGVGEGTTTITITSDDNPEITKTVTVTVYKKYKVIYIYTEGYTVPDTAPILTETDIYLTREYRAGTDVTVSEIPTAEGYSFVGWTTADADIIGNGFRMPEKDVVLQGYFKIPVSDIEIQGNKEITLAEGDESEIKVTVTPDNAYIKELKYTSSNPDIAEVTEDGKIIAKENGTVTITVTSVDNPEIYDTITVTVVKEYKVTYEFIGEVIPDNVTAPDEAVYVAGSTVKVEDNASAEGYIFSGWSTEDATVENGKFVINNHVHFVGSWTKINYYDVTYGYEGDVPANAPEAPDSKTYEEGSTVTVATTPSLDGYIFSGWSTKDADITSGSFNIYNDVVITGKWKKIPVYHNVTYKYEGNVPEGAPTVPEFMTYLEGTNVVIADAPSLDGYTFSGWSTEDADITSGSFNIYNDVVIKGSWTKVNIPADGITANKTEINLEPGDSEEIKITVSPENTTDKSVTYTSSNPEVAEVTPDGTVIAKKDGEAIITVTTADGTQKSITVKVTVKTPVKYYKVTYAFIGDIIPEGVTAPKDATYEAGSKVTVSADTSAEGYIFSGWTTDNVTVANGEFVINNDVHFVGSWTKAPGPVTEIIVPDTVTVILGKETPLGAHVNDNAINKALTYTSRDESIAKIDENGNIIGIAEGITTITVASVENPTIYEFVTVVVTTDSSSDTTHYIVFGKTEKIGWYSVSVDGGKTFFTQFGNDHLEVKKGTEIIVKANDVFGDPFTFYINGEAAKPDENGYVHILVDKFILIGALGIPVVAPDAEESLTFFQQLIQKIKDFFAMIASWFKF